MKNYQDLTIPETEPATIKALVEAHRKFLRFLEKRVESTTVAEEILQNAFVKVLEKGAEIRSEETSVAWFYRLLRNAVVDHYRRRDVERRGLAKEARESLPAILDEETKGAVCACMKELLPSLKSEYADILRKVDLEEQSIADIASQEGITINNTTVRLHRARQALKRQLERSCGTCAAHACLDCSCSKGKSTKTS